MLVICPIFDRIELLPFYIRHYEHFGARRFAFAIYRPVMDKLVSDCLSQYCSVEWSTYHGPVCHLDLYDSTVESLSLNQIRSVWSSQHEWYCLADLDEFLYLRGRSLHDMALLGDELACDGFVSTLVDRVSNRMVNRVSNSIDTANFPVVPTYGSATLDDTFSYQCNVSRVAGANCQKISIARIDQPISAGNHMIPGRIRDVGNENHHFKWTAGIQARLADKHKRMTALGKPWANELARELELIESGKYATDECGFKAARRIGI